jgi:probable HAF family extracellular repeat protein
MIDSLFSHLMPVPRLAATTSTIALRINASGQIVGAYQKGGVVRGFLYSGGTYTTLSPPGMVEAHASGINALGQITGWFLDRTTPDGFKSHGFLYINGLYATFDCPWTTYWTVGKGINAAGHIVGDCAGASHGSGFLYINGLYAVIDYPSATNTNAADINDNGQIVGGYRNGSSYHGFLLSGGTYTTIDYPSATHTFLWGINNHGQVVGEYTDSSGSSGRGFLYDSNGGTYTPLNLPAGITGATGINDDGQLVGGYYNVSGGHGFLYDPNSGTFATLDVP